MILTVRSGLIEQLPAHFLASCLSRESRAASVHGKAERNARKLQILELAEEEGEITSADVSKELGITLHNASMLLRRYWKQGLLSRKASGLCNRKTYSIRRKGRRRLRWLQHEPWKQT